MDVRRCAAETMSADAVSTDETAAAAGGGATRVGVLRLAMLRFGSMTASEYEYECVRVCACVRACVAWRRGERASVCGEAVELKCMEGPRSDHSTNFVP